MQKVAIPEKIKIFKSRKERNIYGGVSSKLDSKTRVDGLLRRVSNKAKTTNNLSRAALIQLHSTEFDNIKGYLPSIGPGRTSDGNRSYNYWFTAPDGKTRLPLDSGSLDYLLQNTRIDKGLVKNKCVIIKKGTTYKPILKTDSSIQTLLENIKNNAFLKTKHLNEGDKVLYRGYEYIYLGIYSVTNTSGWSNDLQRMHIIFQPDKTKKALEHVIIKRNFFEELALISRAPSDYKLKDYSEDLTKAYLTTNRRQGYRSLLFPALFAKSRNELLNTIHSVKFKESQQPLLDPYKAIRNNELLYFKRKPVIIRANYRSKRWDIYSVALNRSGILSTVRQTDSIEDKTLDYTYAYNRKSEDFSKELAKQLSYCNVYATFANGNNIHLKK